MADKKELCLKCPNEVRDHGQRYCLACHAAAQKAYRDRQREDKEDQLFHVEQSRKRARGTKG